MAAILLFVVARQREADSARTSFLGEAAHVASVIQEAVDTKLGALDRLATFFTASEHISRGEFFRLAKGILAEAPSILALEWAPQVTEADRAIVEGDARSEGLCDFRITEYGPSAGLVAAGRRPVYYPVFYVEPMKGNEPVVGFDLASNPARRAALEKARDTGNRTATEPIILVQESKAQLGCLVFLPVYRSATPPLTVAERRESLQGLLLCVLRLGDLLGAAVGGAWQEGIDLRVRDTEVASEPATLFSSARVPAAFDSHQSWTAVTRLADRTWAVDFVAKAAYLAKRRTAQPWLLLLAGLAMAAALQCQSAIRARYTAEIEQARRNLEKTVSDLGSARNEAALFDTITERVNSGLSLIEVLDQIFDAFQPVIPYDRIGFSLVDGESNSVRAHWAKSGVGPIRFPQGYAAPLKGSSLERVARTGAPRIINDLEAYLAEHPQSASTRMILREGMRSSLTCPLVAKGKTIGFLFFSSIESNTYRNNHIATFMRVARHMSVIAEKGRLHDELLSERQRSESLLHSLLPRRIADRLKTDPSSVAEAFDEATVLFADLVDFCGWSSSLAPDALVSILNQVFSRFDTIAFAHGVEKISTVGDAYVAACGLPMRRADHAEVMARFALALNRAIAEYRLPGRNEPLTARIGMHTGPVVAGVVGQRAFRYDVWGPTVNLASRLQSLAEPGGILISRQTRDRLGGAFAVADNGRLEVKGLGGHETYALLGESEPAAAGATAGPHAPGPLC